MAGKEETGSSRIPEVWEVGVGAGTDLGTYSGTTPGPERREVGLVPGPSRPSDPVVVHRYWSHRC